jgi:hypothetical protein
MKKTSNTTRWLLAFSLIAAITFSSCKKEESLTPLTATETDPVELAATQEATAAEAATEAQFDDVFNITASMNKSEVGEDLGVSANVSGLSELGSTTTTTARCFTITVVPNIPHVFPKTVTIDFGAGCLGRDGKYRKGKIVSIYTNPMVVPGAKVSTTFVGYYVDSFKVEGTHITENTSTPNMQGWKVKVIDGKITNTNTYRWRKWNSVKDVLQVAGTSILPARAHVNKREGTKKGRSKRRGERSHRMACFCLLLQGQGRREDGIPVNLVQRIKMLHGVGTEAQIPVRPHASAGMARAELKRESVI